MGHLRWRVNSWTGDGMDRSLLLHYPSKASDKEAAILKGGRSNLND